MRPCQGVSVAPCSARKPICRTRAVHPHPRTSSCSTKSHPVSICTGSCCKTSCCKSACPAPCRSACTAPCCRAQTWRSQACPYIVPCSPCSRDRSQSRSGCMGFRRASFGRAKPDGSQCIHLPVSTALNSGWRETTRSFSSFIGNRRKFPRAGGNLGRIETASQQPRAGAFRGAVMTDACGTGSSGLHSCLVSDAGVSA